MTTTNRLPIPAPSTNGTGTGTRAKPHQQGRTRESRTRNRKRTSTNRGSDSAKHWAVFGVALTGILSAGLNGYANSQHATIPWAGWLLGIAVPVLVLTLAKVAGERWRGQGKHDMAVATFAAASGAALLLLSVWHCATSIALLTGAPAILALPQAIAIDCGLVACEVALIVCPCDRAGHVV